MLLGNLLSMGDETPGKSEEMFGTSCSKLWSWDVPFWQEVRE